MTDSTLTTAPLCKARVGKNQRAYKTAKKFRNVTLLGIGLVRANRINVGAQCLNHF